MSENLLDQVTVVIRSVHERTETLCRELIVAQGVTPENVEIVREAPFSKAMLVSFEIGIARNKPWTLCIDADVLLRPGSIQKLIEVGNKQPEIICEIQGFVLDKYIGGPRTAGNHLYRTSLLKEVIQKIPREGVDIRPETHALEAMKRSGYPWFSIPYLVGLHDFEQSFDDIFRKSIVHAHKNLNFAELFLPIWRSGADADLDYRVALHGFARGVEYNGLVKIDIRDEIYKFDPADLGIAEKADIELESWSLDRVEKIIVEWKEPELYLKRYPDRLGLDNKKMPTISKNKFHKVVARIGLARAIVYFIGGVFKHLGQALQSKVSPQKT